MRGRNGIGDQRWTRDGIVAQWRIVYVDQDPRICILIEILSNCSGGESVRASSSDLEIDALRIGLRSIKVFGTVQCDCLVAKNVLARRDI